MTPQRFEFIDIAKGLGILAVVWAHIMLVGWSYRLIYAFHMPLFFFISGFLFNEGKYPSFGSFITKRFRRLIVPYLAYSLVTWCIWALFRYIRGDDVQSYIMPLLQTFIAQGSGTYLVHNSALWFIPCLFAVEIMYFFIRKTDDIAVIMLCIFAGGGGLLLKHLFGEAYLQNMPWNLDAALFALPFYGTANLLRKHLHSLNSKSTYSRPIICCMCIVLAPIIWYLSQNYGDCSMGSSSYNCNVVLFFARASIGIALTLLVSMLLSFCNVNRLMSVVIDALKWCGRNSLDIMCMHIPIKGVAIIIAAKILKPSVDISSYLRYSTIVFIMTMTVASCLIIALNTVATALSKRLQCPQG